MNAPIHSISRFGTQALLAWVLSAGLSFAQENARNETGWGVTCLSERVCELKTEIIQNSNVAAHVSVFNIRGHVWLQYTIPLGVDLNRGIQISRDDEPPMEASIDSCTAFGCSGRLPLTPEIIEGFKEGSSLRIYFVNPSIQETFVIEFSLSGFTSGFRELSQ